MKRVTAAQFISLQERASTFRQRIDAARRQSATRRVNFIWRAIRLASRPLSAELPFSIPEVFAHLPHHLP
jgi:hypothetical protein